MAHPQHLRPQIFIQIWSMHDARGFASSQYARGDTVLCPRLDHCHRIVLVVMNGPRFWQHWNSFHHLQPLLLESLDLVRIVRQKPNRLPVDAFSEAEISEDGSGNVVFTFISTVS